MRFFSVIFCALMLFAVARESMATGANCKAWPGEISPLPSVDHDDPLRAEWAARRSEELAELASFVQRVNVAESYRIWQHVLCLDSENEQALQAMKKSRLVQIHRPQVESVPKEPKMARSERIEVAFSRLSGLIQVGPRKQVQKAAPVIAKRDRTLEIADQQLETADQLVQEARFREALSAAKEARDKLQPKASSAAIKGRLVRAEVLIATSEIALGRKAEAKESFARALRLDPNLELDANTTSPKVFRVFRSARILSGN